MIWKAIAIAATGDVGAGSNPVSPTGALVCRFLRPMLERLWKPSAREGIKSSLYPLNLALVVMA